MKRISLAIALSIMAMSSAAFADGAKTFAAKCASCHGKDGKGKTPMGTKLKLKDLKEQKLTDADMIALITNGKVDKTTGKPTMPAFKGKIADPAIKELVPVVRAFSK